MQLLKSYALAFFASFATVGRIMAGAIAGSAILELAGVAAGLRTITLTINNSCNLQCPHCYLQYNGQRRVAGPGVIQAIQDADYEHLAIVGKEPLVNRASADLAARLVDAAVTRGRRASIITNGLGLSLLSFSVIEKLAYIDVSFDGGPATYHKYRGADYKSIAAQIARIQANGFSRFRALNVISEHTVGNIPDMMRVRELLPDGPILFSPYIPTRNHGFNRVVGLTLRNALAGLAGADSFVNDANSTFLIAAHEMEPLSGGTEEFLELVQQTGLAGKVLLIREDPLNLGLMRVTYDGYAMAPLASLHTVDYRAVGIDISNRNLNDIYTELRNSVPALAHAN